MRGLTGIRAISRWTQAKRRKQLSKHHMKIETKPEPKPKLVENLVDMFIIVVIVLGLIKFVSMFY